MGFEYFADATLTPAIIASVTSAIAADARFVVLHASGGQMSLRIAALPLQPGWPEDVALELTRDRVLVLFHGGPHGEILDALQAILARAGCSVAFDDL